MLLFYHLLLQFQYSSVFCTPKTGVNLGSQHTYKKKKKIIERITWTYV